MSLRRGAKDALTTTLEVASCATTAATLRTLQSSPRVDANPWAARVRRARWLLLLLAAVVPPALTATLLLLSALLLLWRTLLLVVVWAWLHDEGQRRRRLAERAAPRQGGDQSRGDGHLCWNISELPTSIHQLKLLD